MSWEIWINENGIRIAEHVRRKSDRKNAITRERCRFIETRPGHLSLNYFPLRDAAVRPKLDDYQELADITGYLVCGVNCAGKEQGEPVRPARLLFSVDTLATPEELERMAEELKK